jgi:hypothetical protein
VPRKNGALSAIDVPDPPRSAGVEEQAADPVLLVPGLDPQDGDLGGRPVRLVVVERQVDGGAFGVVVAAVPVELRRRHAVDAARLGGGGAGGGGCGRDGRGDRDRGQPGEQQAAHPSREEPDRGFHQVPFRR